MARTAAQIQADITQVQNEIKRRGGPAKAPGFASKLQTLQAELSAVQGGGQQAGPTLPPDFDPQEYLRANPDVAAAGVDPAQHYLTFGFNEGRAWRMDQNPNGVPSQEPAPSPSPSPTPQPTPAPTPAPAPGPSIPTPVGQPVPLPPFDPTDTPPAATPGNITDGIDTGGVTDPTNKMSVDEMLEILGVGEDIGRRLGNEFFSPGSLGRLKEQLSPAETDALNKLKLLTETAGQRSPEEQAFLDDLKAKIAATGQIDPNVQRAIDLQFAHAEKAGQFTNLENEAIGVARDAMQGLSAPQIQAMREAAMDEIQRGYQGQARELARLQANMGVRGAAATAQLSQLGQSQVREGRNLERDLMIKDIDERRMAREAFTNLVGTRTDAMFERSNAANRSVADTSLADYTARQNAGIGYSNVLGGTLSNFKTTEGNQKQAAADAYGTFAGRTGDTLRDIGQFNLNQLAAERSGMLSSILSGMGLATGQSASFRAEDFANRQFDETLEETRQSRQDQLDFLGKQLKIYEKIFKQTGQVVG